MNYSHILCIQIWSDKTNQTTTYGNILNRVKHLVTDELQTQEIDKNGKTELVSLLWSKASLSELNKELYTSDIVTNASHISDNIIYQHTQKMLEEIEQKLSINKKFDSDYKIVFSIVKPVLPTRSTLLDNVILTDL